MSAIRVLIVDDSAVVRQVLTELLREDAGVEVLAAVADPLFAMQRMKAHWPDVIVLDVEMPRMDGITFLRKIMSERPTPVIICSTLTESGAATTLEALSAGAVSIITKPKAGLKGFLGESAAELSAAIRAAARANLNNLGRRGLAKAPAAPLASRSNHAASPAAEGSVAQASDRPRVPAKHSADVILAPAGERAMSRTTERVVALGTSTGGTQALQDVLASLPNVCPGLVIVQHMPPQFTAAFAKRLDSLCQIEVREARDRDRVAPGCALIAPGGRHLLLQRSGAQYYVEVRDGPPVNRHCPSVDVLFRSVARAAGRNALGVIMTGMGDDGARGLKEMRDAGAGTIAQDEASCVVFGMPKEAIRMQAAERVLPLEALPEAILTA
ncbi:MAG: chemotaxis response regulator protein-glutamate methylesterase [Gammaproteobacteria bacterium]|nr:chemotaxis response regulator protein-glutamate methylesterase [Gammaproteobacteria bacterium]MDE2263078.1 chemotaxis response regulator protein-glutamate methylesterase [Gammaproteobacteria bacterium]